MSLRILILAALLANPATAQPLPSDPAAVMARIMAAFSGIDRPPAEVMKDFLPEAGPQDSIVGPIPDLPAEVNDRDAVQFTVVLPGADPFGGDGIALNCIRFGPPTLAWASQSARPVGPMLMNLPAEGWTGDVGQDLPELGSPQAFPEGAILRQDCAVRFGVPADMAVQTLQDWPAAAIKAVEAHFGTLTASRIKGMGDNPRTGIRASDPRGDGAVQIRLMMGILPYRPFDDVTLPAFGLELRAATYLFAPAS